MKKSVLFLLTLLIVLTVAVPTIVIAGSGMPSAGTSSNDVFLATDTSPTTAPTTEPSSTTAPTAAPSPTGAVISTGTPVPSASPSASASASPSPSATDHTHKYGDWKVTKEATCEEAGERTRKCSCGRKQTEEIPALGHEMGEWEVLYEATAYNPGMNERACLREGCEYVEDEETPMLEDTSTPEPAAETPQPTMATATDTSIETVATDTGQGEFPTWIIILCGVAAVLALGAIVWSVLMFVKNNGGGGGGKPSGGGHYYTGGTSKTSSVNRPSGTGYGRNKYKGF